MSLDKLAFGTRREKGQPALRIGLVDFSQAIPVPLFSPWETKCLLHLTSPRISVCVALHFHELLICPFHHQPLLFGGCVPPNHLVFQFVLELLHGLWSDPWDPSVDQNRIQELSPLKMGIPPGSVSLPWQEGGIWAQTESSQQSLTESENGESTVS